MRSLYSFLIILIPTNKPNTSIIFIPIKEVIAIVEKRIDGTQSSSKIIALSSFSNTQEIALTGPSHTPGSHRKTITGLTRPINLLNNIFTSVQFVSSSVFPNSARQLKYKAFQVYFSSYSIKYHLSCFRAIENSK